MRYALNVFKLILGREDDYREYNLAAGRIVYGLGGRVVAAGRDSVRELRGDASRRCLIVVEFPGEMRSSGFSTRPSATAFIGCARTRRPITSGPCISRGT
jgi:uncharacterized protein (DUF1330 family)